MLRTAAITQPPNIAMRTPMLCLTAMASVCQLRLGFLRFIIRPNAATNSVNTGGRMTHRRPETKSGRNTMQMHALQNSSGMTVKSMWSLSFAWSTALGCTGSDCAIQRPLPSSETEGAVISFIAPRTHTPNASRAVKKPSGRANISNIDTMSAPFMSKNTPAMRRIGVARAQFNMYVGLESRWESSRCRSAEDVLRIFAVCERYSRFATLSEVVAILIKLRARMR